MAVTAKFLGDFTSFNDGIDKAVLKLRKFDDGVSTLDKDLSKFGNRFSGAKIINDANLMAGAIDKLGGVSKLTERELQQAGNAAAEAAAKMKALGMDVPERLQNLAKHATTSTKEVSLLGEAFKKLGPMIAATFTVGAVVNFAKDLGAFAGKMQDLSAETGIGVERLQALNYAAAGAGLTIEDITGGVSQLSKRLAGGEDSATRAVERLGLSIYSLQQLSPDEAFMEIGKAVAGIESPMERTRTAMELFGRSGSRMLRLMTDDLGGLMDAAEKSGAVIEEELIKRADDFDDAWTQAILKVKALMASFVLGPTTEEIGRQIEQLRSYERQGGKLRPEQQSRLESLLDQFNASTVGTMAGGLVSPKSPFGAGGALALPDSVAMRAQADADAKKATATAKATVALEKFGDELQKFLTDDFRQGAAADAKGALGFLASTTASDLARMGANQFPEPGRIVNKAGGLQGLLSIIAPGGPGGSNISRGGGGGFLKNLGGSLLGSAKSSFSLGNIAQSLIGSFLPGPGQLAELAVKGISKLFGKLTGGEGKKTNDMRDQFISAAGGIDVLAEKARQAGTSVDALLKAKNVKDFEAAVVSLQGKFGQFASEAEADAARLEAAIQRYGISFEEAGAAFQKLKLDEQAKELIEDWRVLVGSGIDIGVVNEKMSEEINKYLQLALRVGQEIPNAFRPILANMIQQGTLTDEAGNAITDLEATGLKFAETMTEGFDRVVQKLDELIGRLQAAGTAINSLPSIPSGPSSVIPSNAPGNGEIPSGASLNVPSNEDPTANLGDMPSFAKGTGGSYINFGSGTPAMLHGRERVMTEGEGAAQASNMAAVVAAVDRVAAQLGFLQQILPDQMFAAAQLGRSR